MAKRKVCIDCGAALKKDDIALSRKMIGRAITDFYCVRCLAVILDVEVENLLVKIQEFKEQGCALFL